MDIWDGLRIVVRRWYVAAPIALAFTVFAFLSSGRVAADYTAEASTMLLGPNDDLAAITTPDDTAYNPYLSSCGTCQTVGHALMLSMDSAAVRGSMADEGWSTTYTVAAEPRTPIVLLEATSRDPDVAVGTIDALIDRMSAELVARQEAANAPEDRRITLSVLAQDSEPRGDFTGQTRVRLTLVAIGLALAAGAAFATEALLYYRGRWAEHGRGAPATASNGHAGRAERSGSGAASGSRRRSKTGDKAATGGKAEGGGRSGTRDRTGARGKPATGDKADTRGRPGTGDTTDARSTAGNGGTPVAEPTPEATDPEPASRRKRRASAPPTERLSPPR